MKVYVDLLMKLMLRYQYIYIDMDFEVILVQKCLSFRNDCWPTSNITNDTIPWLLSQKHAEESFSSIGWKQNRHHGWLWTHRHTRLEQGKNYIDLNFLVLQSLSTNSCMSYQPTIFGERRVRLHQRMSTRPHLWKDHNLPIPPRSSDGNCLLHKRSKQITPRWKERKIMSNVLLLRVLSFFHCRWKYKIFSQTYKI